VSRRWRSGALVHRLPRCVGTLVLLALSAPARAAESAAPTQAPARTEDAGSVALRLSLGIGAGNVGIAARAGAEVDYWPTQQLGIGVLAALTGQGTGLGDSFHNWLFAPAVLVSSEPHGRGLFASAGVGYASGAYTERSGGPFSCDPCEERYAFQGPGVVLSGGWGGRTGNVDMGGALVLDLLTVDTGGERKLTTVTVNFTVSFSGG
jgi:hypothetical protein